MKKITIYEVAKESGVSLATVSRVINGSSVVKEKTRLKVEEVIAKLGYKPNAMAQGLALQKTTTVALIVSDNSVYNNAQVLKGLTDVAKIYKYNISLYTISDGFNSANEIVDAVIKSRADGAIVFDDKFTQEHISMLEEYDVAVVFMGVNKFKGEKLGSVFINFEEMAYQLAKKYITQGKKNIALVEDRKNKFVMTKMIDGISKAFNEHQLSFDGYVAIPENHRSSYNHLIEYFKHNSHELVITYRDSQAIATLNALTELNKLSSTEIVCALDSKYNAMVRPQISGFKIPYYDLGAVAMRILTKLLAKKDPEEQDQGHFEKEIELGYLFTKRGTTKE